MYKEGTGEGSGKTLCHDISTWPITSVSLAVNTYCMMHGLSLRLPTIYLIGRHMAHFKICLLTYLLTIIVYIVYIVVVHGVMRCKHASRRMTWQRT